MKKKRHEHHLIPYWGGWYCPKCKTGKYAKLKPDEAHNRKIRGILDTL